MQRLIDADALNGKYRLMRDVETGDLVMAIVDVTIDAQPIVDAEPVRHGRWIQLIEYDIDENAVFQCSVCGGSDMHAKGVDVPYCWHCGARMDKE